MCNLYYTGRQLDGVECEYTAIIEGLGQLNQTQAKLFCETYLYVVKKLRGTDIIGNEFDMNGKLKVAAETNNVTLAAVTNMALVEASVQFQEWEEAIRLLAQTGDLRKVFVAEFINIRFTFFEGIIFSRRSLPHWTGRMTRQKKSTNLPWLFLQQMGLSRIKHFHMDWQVHTLIRKVMNIGETTILENVKSVTLNGEPLPLSLG